MGARDATSDVDVTGFTKIKTMYTDASGRITGFNSGTNEINKYYKSSPKEIRYKKNAGLIYHSTVDGFEVGALDQTFSKAAGKLYLDEYASGSPVFGGNFDYWVGQDGLSYLAVRSIDGTDNYGWGLMTATGYRFEELSYEYTNLVPPVASYYFQYDYENYTVVTIV